MGFTARIEQREQRRHQRDARHERDQHAASGDLAELGQTAVVGRQERQEADGGRGGGKRQRAAGLFSGAPQRHAKVALLVPLGAIAHAELDAEIDAEPDKQHGKRDRDQVERRHHGKPERRRDGKPRHQAEEHRHDDPQ